MWSVIWAFSLMGKAVVATKEFSNKLPQHQNMQRITTDGSSTLPGPV